MVKPSVWITRAFAGLSETDMDRLDRDWRTAAYTGDGSEGWGGAIPSAAEIGSENMAAKGSVAQPDAASQQKCTPALTC